MKCKKISALIIDRLAGELDKKHELLLEKHLASCKECSREFDELNKIWSMTANTLKDEQFDDTLTDESHNRIIGTAYELNTSEPPMVDSIEMQRAQKRKSAWTDFAVAAGFIIVITFLSGLLLPALSSSRSKAREIARQAEFRHEESMGAVKEEKLVDNIHLNEVCFDMKKRAQTRFALPQLKYNIKILPRRQKSKKYVAREAEKNSVESTYFSDDEPSYDCSTYGEAAADFADDEGMETFGASPALDIEEANVEPTSKFLEKREASSTGDSSDKDYGKGAGRVVALSDRSYIRCSSGMETRVFPVDSKIAAVVGENRSEIISFFKRNSVTFPHGSTIEYNKSAGTLTIKNTKQQLQNIGMELDRLELMLEKSNRFSDGMPFIDAKLKPISTFSIDVDTASYTIARKIIKSGGKPPPNLIRPEEFINYFDYHYKSPSIGTFGVYTEAAPSPFRPLNTVLKIGIQGRKLGPDANRQSLFTILIDTSGSMAAKMRMELVKKSIDILLTKMKPYDTISILTCGEQTNYLLKNVPANRKNLIKRTVRMIFPGGETNLEQGIVNAYKLASNNYRPGAFNRVIIFSDGIVNITSESASEILLKVDDARKKGISNTIIAIGGDGDDRLMEALANKGDGNYVFLDSEEEAENVFDKQFAARFREIARDVKIQVEFNPQVVSSYRQIGYQNRQLNKADFRNDSVDAGEVGAGQAVTALYEIKFKPEFSSKKSSRINIAFIRIRYKESGTGEVVEKEFGIPGNEIKRSYQEATPGFKLAEAVAEFAEGLRYPQTPGIANATTASKLLKVLIHEFYSNDSKVKELYELMNY